MDNTSSVKRIHLRHHDQNGVSTNKRIKKLVRKAFGVKKDVFELTNPVTGGREKILLNDAKKSLRADSELFVVIVKIPDNENDMDVCVDNFRNWIDSKKGAKILYVWQTRKLENFLSNCLKLKRSNRTTKTFVHTQNCFRRLFGDFVRNRTKCDDLACLKIQIVDLLFYN